MFGVQVNTLSSKHETFTELFLKELPQWKVVNYVCLNESMHSREGKTCIVYNLFSIV